MAEEGARLGVPIPRFARGRLEDARREEGRDACVGVG